MSASQILKQRDALSVFLIPHFQVDQSLYQSETWYATIHIKMSIIYKKMESHFHIKDGYKDFCFIEKVKAIQKWSVVYL